ncbi:MAG: Rrf2 family transcriptional regulator [Spirochaetaceae bacterium]
MTISTKTRYGFRLMIYLGLNESSESSIQLGEIAKKEDISLKYLEKIVQLLKKDGLVSVKRGPKGGYRLSRESRKISLLDIYQTLEGGYSVIDCVDSGDCERIELCSTSSIWCGLSEVIRDYFADKTLEYIVHEHENKTNMFYI